MTDTQQQTKIVNTLASIKTEHLRLGEQILELEKLLTLQPTASQQTKALFDYWHARWGSVYNEPYVFAGAKDAGGFKRLLKTMTLDDVRLRMSRYLADADPFLAMQRHPLNLFFAQINRWGSSTATPPSARPVGCQHTPACESEVAHTRLMMQQRRTVAM